LRRIVAKATAHVRDLLRMPCPGASHDFPCESPIFCKLCCWIERSRPRHRRIDVRPYVSDLRALPGALGGIVS